jgi:hypothetical protein
LQEHRVIAAAGEDLLSILHDVVEGALIERHTVEAAAATYLVYYRHHLAAEEQEVIPRAAQLLTPSDWAAVAAAPVGADPLFGRTSRRAIASYAGRSRSRRETRTGSDRRMVHALAAVRDSCHGSHR